MKKTVILVAALTLGCTTNVYNVVEPEDDSGPDAIPKADARDTGARDTGARLDTYVPPPDDLEEDTSAPTTDTGTAVTDTGGMFDFDASARYAYIYPLKPTDTVPRWVTASDGRNDAVFDKPGDVMRAVRTTDEVPNILREITVLHFEPIKLTCPSVTMRYTVKSMTTGKTASETFTLITSTMTQSKVYPHNFGVGEFKGPMEITVERVDGAGCGAIPLRPSTTALYASWTG